MKNTSRQNSIEPQVTAHKNGLKKSSAIDLSNLFVNELKDIYGVEKALVIAISKLITNATSNKLVQSLTDHLESTQEHVLRLEDVFLAIGEKVQAKKCEAIEGLIREAEAIMKNTMKGTARDEGIILACQKIEHYEIATYGTLCSFARTLGENDAAILLQKTLDQEYEEDEQLTEIAEAMQSEII